MPPVILLVRMTVKLQFSDNVKAERDLRCDVAASNQTEGWEEVEVDCSNRYYTDPAMLAR